MIAIIYTVIGVTLSLAVKLGVLAIMGRLSWAQFRWPGPVWMDAGLMDLIGLNLGILAASALAWSLSASGIGPWFDWAMAALGLVAGTALTALAFRQRSLRPIIPAATFGAFGAVALWGAFQSSRIVAQAEALDGPNAHIIGQDGRALSRGDLGFFGMEKSRWSQGRHLVVFVDEADGLTIYYWSIRQQRFERDHLNSF